MSVGDTGKPERVEEFLRKSLLGEETINTQFHLFSARSVSSKRLTQPRVLCANNLLLAKSSKYFIDLLSSDASPTDPSLSDLVDANEVPSHIQTDDYGYSSDSDLDDEDDESAIPDALKVKSVTVPTTPPKLSVTTKLEDDDALSEDGSESDRSDMFVMSPEHPGPEMPFIIINAGEAESETNRKTSVHESSGNKTSRSQTMRLLPGSRHILVKDTAFRTWYALLNYLYTDKINFLPLGSTTPRGQSHESSVNAQDEPRCSAKSMYRLACKVGLDHLRDQALAHIRSNLTEHSVLKELSCSLLSSHPQLLEMELDVFCSHVGSAPVVGGFREMARRIADKELVHGAEIIVGICERLLKERQPLPSMLTPQESPANPTFLFHSDITSKVEQAIKKPALSPMEQLGDEYDDRSTKSDSWGVVRGRFGFGETLTQNSGMGKKKKGKK